MIAKANNAPNRFLTVKQFPSYYLAFTESSIRWLIFNEKSNGFNRCVKRIGRKVLIDTHEFEAWVDEQGNGGRPHG